MIFFDQLPPEVFGGRPPRQYPEAVFTQPQTVGHNVEKVDGLSLALDCQFDRWGLTPAEREVALYLLNGLGMRDVAAARGTSERTARKQALAVYAKAGLGGRAELAAFFLEALIVGKVKPEVVADGAAPTDDAAG